jgi:DNA-directed RNA polymerase subunit RPC12/RpoP
MSVNFVPIPSDRFLSGVLEQHKKQFESSTEISLFFQLLKIRFGKLSTKQQKKFQLFFGCLDEGFFKNGDFFMLFKTVLKPLYAQPPHSLQLDYVNYQQEHIDTAMEVLKLGQLFVELFLPRNISEFEYISRLNDAGISNEAGHKAIIDLLLVHRETFLICQELVDVEVKFKEFFRDGYETGFFCEVLREFISSNPNICTFLWYHCDICGKKIQTDRVNDEIRACTHCGGPCVLLPEPTPAPRPTSSAQASDSLQALKTELITAQVSVGETAQKLANVLLENGVFQLSELSVLTQHEFELLIQKLQLNRLQVQKIREASGRL